MGRRYRQTGLAPCLAQQGVTGLRLDCGCWWKTRHLTYKSSNQGARSLWGEESFLPQSKARWGNRQGRGSVMEAPAMRWWRQTRATLFSPSQSTELHAGISPTLKMRTLRLGEIEWLSQGYRLVCSRGRLYIRLPSWDGDRSEETAS